MQINESALEQLALRWFQETGWQTAYGPDLAPEGDAPERTTLKSPLLLGRVRAALLRINPGISESKLHEVADDLLRTEQSELVASNRLFHERLIKGILVEVITPNGELTGDKVSLVDFDDPDRNDWLVVNQFTLKGSRRVRRPDLVLFVNGLPLAVIELKNPLDKDTDVWHAYEQLQTYKAELPDFFIPNVALVVSDGRHARVGSLTADRERFMPWRTIRDEYDKPQLELELEQVVRGFCAPDLFLDYLRHFVLYEEGPAKRLIKKIAAYHQFHAVRTAVEQTMRAAVVPAAALVEVHDQPAPYAGRIQRTEAGSRKGGIVWHTQGSGKSISMACFAGKLRKQTGMENPTLVIITDRSDLDGQLFQQFDSAKSVLGEEPQKVDSRDELRELLADRVSGGIIFTTIQKFSLKPGETRFPLLTARTNVVVIADEAHRSQYGLESKLDPKTGRYRYGFAKHLRDALPYATFVGFTGTPLETHAVDTRQVFGPYVSIYDIKEAETDGATVPIYYESRLAKLHLVDEETEIAEINEEVEEVLEAEADVARREQEKAHWTQLAKLVGAKNRLDLIAADLVAHFEARSKESAKIGLPGGGKGMIVGMSREICARLYDAIIQLRPDWHDPDPKKGVLKVVITGDASDYEPVKSHVHSGAVRKQLEKRFKDPADPLRLVIVRDMWLTGFDVLSLHTMYVDKPMQAHNLMQAIARVNRVFKHKAGGLVVDYIGIATELKRALKTYAASGGAGSPAIDLERATGELLDAVREVRYQLRGVKYDQYRTAPLPLLPLVSDHVLSLEEPNRKRFFDQVLAAGKAFGLCSTQTEADAVSEEVAFYRAVRAYLVKSTTPDEALDRDQRHLVLNQLLDRAVQPGEVENIFALAGIEQTDLSILSDQFLEEVRNLPHKHLAAELLQKLLNDQIKARFRSNVVQERLFTDRLDDTITRYHNRAIDNAQVMQELLQMAREFREAAQRGEDLHLSAAELAFYDALANNGSAQTELGDDTLKAIAAELTEKLRKNTSVDWQRRESVRARLKNLVRITLRRHKYPPDKQEAAVDLVMEQAERLADELTDDNH